MPLLWAKAVLPATCIREAVARGNGGWGYRVHHGTAGFEFGTCRGKFFFEQRRNLMHYKMFQRLPLRFCECCSMLFQLFHVWLNNRSGMHVLPRTGPSHQRGVPFRCDGQCETFAGFDTPAFGVPSAVWLHETFELLTFPFSLAKLMAKLRFRVCFSIPRFFLDLLVLFDGLSSTCAQ